MNGEMNYKRYCWADRVLTHFAVRVAATDPEDRLTDLLANLMHWADHTGENFKVALERAQRNYEGEKRDNE